MRRFDLWSLILSTAVMLSIVDCLPINHDDIPDKAEVVPTPSPEPKPQVMTPKELALATDLESCQRDRDEAYAMHEACHESVMDCELRMKDPEPESPPLTVIFHDPQDWSGGTQ